MLLLAHYENINGTDIQMKSLSGCMSITAVHELCHEVALILLPFHALTGCDVTGKFSGTSKENLFGPYCYYIHVGLKRWYLKSQDLFVYHIAPKENHRESLTA